MNVANLVRQAAIYSSNSFELYIYGAIKAIDW